MTFDKYLDIIADTWLDMYLGNSLPSGVRGYLISTPKDATKDHRHCEGHDTKR